nr:hypothetical protein [Tanacetum cinerariifolium]
MPPSSNAINPVGIPSWRRSSPSSLSGVNPSTRLSPGSWDAFDGSQLHMEPKRPRTDGNIPLRDIKGRGILGSIPQVTGARFPTREIGLDTITVCHARCVPIRDLIGYDINGQDYGPTPNLMKIYANSGARDGVAGIKRRRHNLSSDDVRNTATASGHGRLKEDLESSTWRRCQDCKATSIAWILKTRARGFVLRSLDLHFLSFILGIQYPNLID